MNIEVLSAADVPQYRGLMLHAYEHAEDAFTSTRDERAAEPDSWWVRRIADPTRMSAAFGAFAERKLVGTVALEFSGKPKTRHKALLIGMYVYPESRGCGAGRALVQSAIAFCEQRLDILSINLTVTQGNEAAIGLYRSVGFTEFGVEPMAVLVSSGFKSKVHMCRSIVSGGAPPGLAT